MINNSSSDAQAFRVMASRIDAIRETTPVTGDPLRRPDTVTVAGQLRELGTVITDLADAVLHRADGQHADGLAVMGFAAAVRPACNAASALGVAAHHLTLLETARHPFEDPSAQEHDSRVVGKALVMADKSLRGTASCLHAASTAVAPASDRAQVARSRSTTPAPSSSVATPTAPTSAFPLGRTARGR
ncbi:hypothetical protein ACFVDU_17685 [Streptomyces albidoflavus]